MTHASARTSAKWRGRRARDDRGRAPRVSSCCRTGDARQRRRARPVAVVVGALHGGCRRRTWRRRQWHARVPLAARGRSTRRTSHRRSRRSWRHALRARGLGDDDAHARHADRAVGSRSHRERRCTAIVFVSIHVNAANPRGQDPAAARGYETYFLAEAKTEDAKRVERMENESVHFETRLVEREGRSAHLHQARHGAERAFARIERVRGDDPAPARARWSRGRAAA